MHLHILGKSFKGLTYLVEVTKNELEVGWSAVFDCPKVKLCVSSSGMNSFYLLSF